MTFAPEALAPEYVTPAGRAGPGVAGQLPPVPDCAISPDRRQLGRRRGPPGNRRDVSRAGAMGPRAYSPPPQAQVREACPPAGPRVQGGPAGCANHDVGRRRLTLVRPGYPLHCAGFGGTRVWRRGEQESRSHRDRLRRDPGESPPAKCAPVPVCRQPRPSNVGRARAPRIFSVSPASQPIVEFSRSPTNTHPPQPRQKQREPRPGALARPS